MKKSRFSEAQIVGILKEHEAGEATKEICRRHGISPATFYTWRANFGGMEILGGHFKLYQVWPLQNVPARAKWVLSYD